MFLHLIFASCLIQKFEENQPIRYYNNLLDKTVVLIEAEVYYRNTDNEAWQKLPADHEIGLELKIFRSVSGDWASFKSTQRMVSEYVRYLQKTNFFYTATDNDYYLYQFMLDSSEDVQYALKTNFYEGIHGDPNIMSQADNQIKELKKNIEESMEYITQISNVQKLDGFRDEEYYNLIVSIRNIVFIIIGLKIAVFFCMFNWFNKKLRDFYVSKKILKK